MERSAHDRPLLRLTATDVWLDRYRLIAVASIRLTHIAIDRIVGYGPRFPTGFEVTRLR